MMDFVAVEGLDHLNKFYNFIGCLRVAKVEIKNVFHK